jgi:CHAD domain-containing protein
MVLERYGRAQLDAITANEPGARQADPDAIHDMRVATRRLRSTLRTFRPLLERERSEALRAELQWLGLVEALDGPRYAALLEGLDRLVQSQLANRHRPRRLRRLARKAVRRADDALAAADHGRAGERGPRLHEARKAYKRARYAAEALTPVAGRPARQLAKRLTELQDVLGAHQDSVVTGERLRALGVRAHLGGDNAFTYGLLHARQHDAAERQLAELRTAVKRAKRRSVRRWLKD